MTEESQLRTEQGAVSVAAFQLTDTGKVRSENQDFAIMTTPDEERASGKGRLMVVADGMGGHRGGATASRLASTTIRDRYLASEEDDVPAALLRALESANAAVFAESQANPDLRGMGTTCSALVVKDGIGYVGHIGDSRIYRIRRGEIEQLTQDHSLVASMVREGLLTSDEAEVHPRRNVLQRSMGVAAEVEIDISEPFAVLADDIFVLCSDGLHGLVKEAEMVEVTRLPLDDAAREFVRRALDRGAPDNVTVIVSRIVGGPQHDDDVPTLGVYRPPVHPLDAPTVELPLDAVSEAPPPRDPEELTQPQIPATEIAPGAPIDIRQSSEEPDAEAGDTSPRPVASPDNAEAAVPQLDGAPLADTTPAGDAPGVATPAGEEPEPATSGDDGVPLTLAHEPGTPASATASVPSVSTRRLVAIGLFWAVVAAVAIFAWLRWTAS
jgi:PPM family protein phosphatase